jgi:hypothetical protein
MHASGSFEVKITPEAADSGVPAVGSMSIAKQYHGDLEAASKGRMLASSGSVKGSACYVAIEQVTGTLHGRSGDFLLHHSGTMTRGVPQLTISVVPDSGTGDLTGLSGALVITVADGKHSYDFEYTLPE